MSTKGRTKLPLCKGNIQNYIFSSKTQPLVVAASWDSSLRVFSWVDPARLKPLGAMKFHSGAVQALTWSGQDKWIELKGESSPLIAAGGKDHIISFWRIYNDKAQAIAPVIIEKKGCEQDAGEHSDDETE